MQMEDFHPVVRRWFFETYGAPTPPQELGWPSIASGANTLILAPTGSGKTLAAFLWAINHLIDQRLREELSPGVRILYVSPLKALNNDIERNLDAPLEGLRAEAERQGIPFPPIRTAVRTGDTTQSQRASMLRKPPDILITTPESLYLMLTSVRARPIFRTVQYLIVDEIHALCGNKRGVHLSLSIERLQALAEQEIVRIGLSATQRPLDKIAAFLGGRQRQGETYAPRPVRIVDAGRKKEMDLRVVCAPPDFAALPQDSVWPLVFEELEREIRAHRTTLVFVNNRRLAERVAAQLNNMMHNLYAVPRTTEGEPPAADAGLPHPDDILVQAYHGSMSRQAREQMEADLKGGKLRALIATSSLELGIDIGSIDLVVQLQSPKGVARGLQRIGRSGHLVTASSKGRIFPTHREDLVESAVVAEAMARHDVEYTQIPVNCLDVLAQQIVAMVSVEEWDVDKLFDLVRQSYCYGDLSRQLFAGVVGMLAGRYTDEAFRELRARISWDKGNNILRALPGSSHLAITSGGTIADRGYFGVYLEDGTTRVGEVDEEFVYESRTGDTFILGTSVWRMLDIDANRITVAPAPGQPARMPFWRGEGIGRSYELGMCVGAFRRMMSEQADKPDCLASLQRQYPIDANAAWNIQEYFRRQRQHTGIVPHDRLILVEGFRDEIGDPRVVVHASFGRRVNGLLGLLASRRLHDMLGVEPQMLYNDDGILLRCPDVDTVPLDVLEGVTLAAARDAVLDEVVSSPLFAGQFRQNAARALLMPKVAPGKRTPLWLQRLRASDLLQVARQYSDFPIIVETMRDVLNDVLDFKHFLEVVQGIESGAIAVRTTTTEVPSPFSASLLFDFIAVYMYQADQPHADRLSQYLAVNREILSEVVDLETLPGMIRPEAIDEVERQLQHAAPGFKARSPEELMEIMVRLGDLSEAEIQERCADDARAMLRTLESDGRAVRVTVGGETRWVAGEDAEMYRSLPSSPDAGRILRRYLQSHGPTTGTDLAQRFGIGPERVESLTAGWQSDAAMARGRFRPAGMPGANEQQWCYRPNVEKIHRQTITILRKEISPSTPAEFTSFLQRWQRLEPATRESGAAGLDAMAAQLQGLPLPAEVWERDILARRMRDDVSMLLSSPSAAGGLVWVGAGNGRMMMVQRGNGSLFIPPVSLETLNSLGEAARRILDFLTGQGASFFADIRNQTRLSLEAMNSGIAELFWNGIITNDVYNELRAVRRSARMSEAAPIERVSIVDPHHNPGRSRLMRHARRALRDVPGWNGRWSLVRTPSVLGETPDEAEIAASQALQLLDRYGILAREFHRRESLLPWPALAGALQRMELRGEIRRGYFVRGLSGMQYAIPAAIEELRRPQDPRPDGSVLLLNSCDPANPYGAGVEFGTAGGDGQAVRLARIPGNYIAFDRGGPVLIFEAYGTRVRTVGSPTPRAMREALQSFVALGRLPEPLRPFREITMEYCDAVRPAESPLAPVLQSLGFRRDMNQTMRWDGY